jgi:signal transduction histidine kinase
MKPEISQDWKIKEYYYVIQISGIVSLTLFAIIAYMFPGNFRFLGNQEVFLPLIFAIFFYHTLLFLLELVIKKKIIFTFVRYGWIAFFCGLIYISGGILSPVLFLLVFPLFVSAVDLEAAQTRNAGIVIIGFLITLFFFDAVPKLPVLITWHVFVVVIFSTISYYMYKLVKETLSERFEKEKAKQEIQELLELDKVKSDFITIASHQLRTPLSGVLWALSEMNTETTMDEQEKSTLIKGSFEKIGQAITVVNELIKTVELDMREVRLRTADVDVVALLHNLVDDLSLTIRKKETEVEIVGIEKAIIQADIKVITLAFSNVIDNAIKYSPKGKVVISISQDDAHTTISIKDNGIGIPKGDQQFIFQRFFRAKNALVLEPNESGVGLYTTKKIIELHKGKVNITSEENKGTTMEIILPTFLV